MDTNTFTALLKSTSTYPKHPHDTIFPTVYPDPPVFERAGTAGHRTLWVVFVLMLIASVSFIALAWSIPPAKRLYHALTATIVVIATLSYYAMATGTGVSLHHVRIRESHKGDIPATHHHVYREVYYARYIDWALTTPLLLIDLALLAGLNGAQIYSAVVADLIMIVTGLFAAFAHNERTRWGWYTMACLAFLWIIYSLLVTGRNTVSSKGSTTSKFYTSIALYTVVLWTAYPIVWAVADGSRKVSLNTEIITYAILDVLAKGVFGAWLLRTHGQSSDTHANVGGFWAHGLNTEGAIRIADEEDGA